MPQPLVLTDGALAFDGGVSSLKATTVASQFNPNGLQRNELAWMANGTVRQNGISPRPAWWLKGNIPPLGKHQGSEVYAPLSGDPYILSLVDGHLYKIDPDNPTQADDLSIRFGLTMPITEQSFFCQGEQFMIVQAGDFDNPGPVVPGVTDSEGRTLPLFWDGASLRRSRGIFPGALSSANPPTLSVTLKNIAATPGYVFPDETSASNPLGVPYTGFTVPPVGNTVVVALQAAFQGSVGDNIDFAVATTGQMQLQSIQIVNPNFFLYTYLNLSIPPGTNVPAQFAPGQNAGLGANFPAFVAPAIGGTYQFGFVFQLVNPGTTNTWAWTTDNNFQVTAIASSSNDVQAQICEIPAATAMVYYMGRLWYAQGIQYSAGDIVGGTYGTTTYGLRDSILKVTENPLALGGDGFAVPAQAGNIRGMAFAGNINTQLGEGQLYVGTREQIYALTVPVTRTDWINANGNNGPLQTVALAGNGWVNDRSIVQVNGDLFFQSIEPSIRSLTAAIRNFSQWGNVPISSEENRALQLNDRALMHAASGIYFDNRLLQTILPYETPVGIAFKGIAPLNFDVISTLKNKLPPAWEGVWEGLNVLQLLVEDFGGRQRAFAMVYSDEIQGIQIWELTTAEKFDKNENRITMFSEFPAFNFQRELDLKKLVSGELWIDNLDGEAVITVHYRPDGHQCWYPWTKFKICTTGGPVPLYPKGTPLGMSYRQTISLPQPPLDCAPAMGRPSYIGYQFQPRVTVHGSCRVRGIFLHAELYERKLYDSLPENCDTLDQPTILQG